MRIESTDDAAVAGLLEAAELWLAGLTGDRPTLIAGWEDAYQFCATVCTTDLGLAFCRRCPEALVRRVASSGRPHSARCPAGVRLLAFQTNGSRSPPGADSGPVAVLRVAPPSAAAAVRVASDVRVAPARLRRAAEGMAAPGPSVRRAAAVLRRPATRAGWQADQRAVAADRRRASAAALAQIAATGEEVGHLYRTARREHAALDRSRRRMDRLAQDAVRAHDHDGTLIAHRIHDTAAQSMVSAFRFLDAARVAAAGQPARPDVDRQLEEASERLLTAIREVRGVLAQVLPPGLHELGLGPAIRARHRFLLAEADGAAPLAGEVVGDLPRLVDWVEQVLYSITGEAIANAVRHSGARTIDVGLRVERGRAVVTVEDDGRGLPASGTGSADGHGLGIPGMTRQTDWLGGRISIAPRPTGGTRVRISIPLARHRRPSDAAPRAPAESRR
jgi:two-component system sensor histidine kinase UhpB